MTGKLREFKIIRTFFYCKKSIRMFLTMKGRCTVKLWGGCFEKTTDALVEDFHSSISFDQRLYKQDILGSVAHARMLGSVGVISEEEANLLITGLMKLLEDIQAGNVEFEIGAEDIHMNVEKLLTERIGTVGKKLHTGQSRNDKLALDLRLYLRSEIDQTKTWWRSCSKLYSIYPKSILKLGCQDTHICKRPSRLHLPIT